MSKVRNLDEILTCVFDRRLGKMGKRDRKVWTVQQVRDSASWANFLRRANEPAFKNEDALAAEFVRIITDAENGVLQ